MEPAPGTRPDPMEASFQRLRSMLRQALDDLEPFSALIELAQNAITFATTNPEEDEMWVRRARNALSSWMDDRDPIDLKQALGSLAIVFLKKKSASETPVKQPDDGPKGG